MSRHQGESVAEANNLIFFFINLGGRAFESTRVDSGIKRQRKKI